jgi:hypothetical protein
MEGQIGVIAIEAAGFRFVKAVKQAPGRAE